MYSKYLGRNRTHNQMYVPHTLQNKQEKKLYSALALPVLLHGTETWTVNASDA